MSNTHKVTTIDGKEPVVYENDVYRITVGRSALTPPHVHVLKAGDKIQDTSPDTYKITNKEWGVVEEEAFALPQAMKLADLLQLQIRMKAWEIDVATQERQMSKLTLPNTGGVINH